jgi:hypothetical protein
LAYRIISVPQNGRYKISFKSTGKAFVRLHEAGIIDADFGHESASNSIDLELNLGAGYHPLLISGLTNQNNELAVSVKFKRLDAGRE